MLNFSRFVTAAVLTIVGLAGSAQVSASTVNLDAEEQAWLEAHPVIRVGPAPNFPPVEFFDDQGRFHGIAADYMAIVEERLEIEFQVVKKQSWSDVVAATQAGEIDVWLEAAKTEDRNRYMLFSEPYLLLPAVIIVRQEEGGNLELDDLAGRRVAAIDGYATVEFLRENAPDLELMLVPSIEEGLSRVAFGSADAIVVSSAPASFYIERLGLTNLRVAGQSGFMWRLSVASRKDWPILHRILAKTFDSIGRDDRRVIYRRWVALDHVPETFVKGWVITACVAGLAALVFLLVLLVLRRGRQRPTRHLGSSSWPVYIAALVVIIAVLLLTVQTERLIESDARDDVALALKGILSSTSTSAHGWLRERQTQARMWAGQSAVQDACRELLALDIEVGPAAKGKASKRLGDELNRLIESNFYSGWAVLSLDRRIIGALDPDLIGVEPNMPGDLMDELFSGERLSAIVIPSTEYVQQGEAPFSDRISVVATVIGPDHSIVGALALRIDPGGEFSRILQRGRIGNSGDTYAFNRAGQAVSLSRFDAALRQMGLIGVDDDSILNLEIRDPGGNMLTGFRPTVYRSDQRLTVMAESAVNGRNGINLEGYRDYRGVPVIGAWAWDDDLGLGISTEIDSAEAYRSLATNRRLFRTFVALTVGLILCLTLLFRLFSGRQQATEARMRLQSAALEAAANGIVITDTNGTIEWVNPAFTELTGYSFSEAEGKNPRILKSGTHGPEFFVEMWNTIRSGRVWSGEMVNRARDGSIYTEEMTITPVRSDAGLITHFVAIKKDVSERIAMVHELEHARELAEEANRAKSAFLANMSHELRTPMNAIIGYSEMLTEDAEDEGHDGMIPDLEKITTSGRHLLSLINDILDLSKIEAGRMDLYIERFDIKQLLEDTIATVEPHAGKNGNSVSLHTDENVGVMTADLTKVRQVLLNILSNAVKFTSGGLITVSAGKIRDRGDRLVISVSDTGIGIPPDQLDRVFEEFSQADDSTTREYGGTGLGIPISQRFCRMMGGEITVESEPGQGSTFTIDLPVTVVPAKHDTQRIESNPGVGLDHGGNNGEDLTG